MKIQPRDHYPIKIQMSEYEGTMIAAAIRRVEELHPSSETSCILGWLGRELARWGVKIDGTNLPKSEREYIYGKNI